MNEYQLGKDIQTILERLERVETSLAALSRNPCSDCQARETAQVSATGTTHSSRDGAEVEVAYKTFTFPQVGRVGYCNWKEPESVTIYSNGDYEDVTYIRCEHGYLFRCDFSVTMEYQGADGHVFTTTSWSRSLAGADSERIRETGWRQAIRNAFNGSPFNMRPDLATLLPHLREPPYPAWR